MSVCTGKKQGRNKDGPEGRKGDQQGFLGKIFNLESFSNKQYSRLDAM